MAHSQKITPREVILQAIRSPGRKLTAGERLPVALLSGGTWTYRQKGLSLLEILEQPAKAAPIIAEINDTIHSDILWPGSGYHNILFQVLGGEIKFRPQGNIDVVKPLLADLAEIDGVVLDKLERSPWIGALRQMVAETAAAKGQEFLVGTSSWGPFTLAGQLYGVERVMSGLYKDKTGIHALLDFAAELCYAYLAPMISRGAEILSLAEPTASGDLISRRHFAEFVVPYLEKVIRRLKADGALITLHICGNISDRLELIPELGVDLLSVDYKVDLATAKQVIGDKIAVAGNVNPVLLKDGTPAEVVEAAGAAIDRWGQGYSFVLMPGCDIPPAVPLENISRFLQRA
ncbi:MAG TPA: uroporphyrinogen decarboxylase family protein [Patescibacteria group bacterium]|nr:uroporphyrinogen decarboxylase family protein [Patescibacteria group bacterium]